jgi:hypothetical protein
MKSMNYWQRFTDSGNIEDYLSYAHREKPSENSVGQKADHLGVNPYAGVHICNRDDNKTSAHRGI